MRIGIYISPSHAVPPDEKNILAPWVLVAQLADGLVKKGYDVVLFAAKGSKTKAKPISGGIFPAVQRQADFSDHAMYQSFVASQNLALLREAVSYVKSHQLDVLHVHTAPEGLYPALLALPQKLPVVVTFHDPIPPERFPGLEKVMELGNVHFVSLSHAQQKGTPFRFAGVVPNGVDTKKFAPDWGDKGNQGNKGADKKPLLITGRIVPEKGFTDAIAAVRRVGVGERLMIVGQKYDQLPHAKRYFEEEIQPAIDGKTVIWEPVVKQDHLVGHYQTAKALLFPIKWEEPFGLVMIEAMACGTPVIAYNHGSVPEVVVDGVTGFIIDPNESIKSQAPNSKQISSTKFEIKKTGTDGLIESIKRIGEIDRIACRRHVEKYYTIEKMVRGYETLYAGIIRHQ